MKKITLFLVAMTMSLLSFAAQPKRIYAYDLSSTLVDKVYTFSFTANETPTSGKIIFYDATSSELVGEIALTNPVLGKNEVEIAEYSLPGNDGQQLNWAIELSAAEVTAFEAVYTGAKKYGRGHAAVDNSPESNYFGQVYVTDRRKTDTDGGLYVYTPSLQLVNNDVYKLGRSRNGYSRPAVAADGTLFLADYTDADRSGIYVVDPSDLTICTQFYDGNRDSNGLFTNTNGEEIGSSTSGVGVFGSGANTVLYTMMEDGSNPSAAVSYHIGQPDGSILKSWSNVPTWICKEFASINVSTNNAFAATEKGVWISQNDAVAVGSRAELVFIDKNGILQFQQDKQMCKGAGLAVNTDNSKLYMSGSNNIVEYNIIWNGNKPTLELSETYSISYAQVSTLSLDYAGNLIACVGASYSSTDSNVMLLVQYTLPTDNNTCEVPAKKADVVTKVEPTVALYTITTNVNDLTMGSVSGNLGTYEDGASAELTAVANEHYEFVNWTGDVNSTENPLNITVDGNKNITANFQEQTKYIITASAADNTMGYVTGGGTYYAGETVTLTAVAKSTYYFVNWSDGNTNATRTFPASANLTLTANFAKANPRAWAYDLKMVEEGDNYKFSFTATTAANATLLFLDKEGNELYDAHDIGAVAAGANTVSIEKAYFTQVKDVYWSVKMDGEAITAVAEITDQSRGIYDFYSTLGVTVDNNPNSEYFGKVYVQATLDGASDGATTRAKEQTAGLFIYNQLLDELNPTSNVGIQPSLPAGYGIGSTNKFNRLAIDPITNNITYCYAISGQPAVFSMDRADLTGTPANLLAGQSGITRSVAHCFDTDGALYVMDLPGSGTIYKIKDGVKTQLTETTNKFVNVNITMTSDGRGGLWVSQNRGQMDGSPYYYQLAHVTSAGAIDWAVNKQTPHGFEGGSSRGALAYDIERQILAQGRNGKVELYTVAYDATTGVPTLTPLHTVASDYLGNNIDGLAFDFAGDLYVVNSSKEKFQKFTLPTADNICTVPAPKSQAIVKEIRHTVTTNTTGNGTVIGAGEYVAGETATLTASPAANHNFVNWTYGSETSTDNPLSLVVNSDITVTANFAPVQYTLIAPTNDENKGTVTGAGTYAHGTEVTLEATPKAGYKLLYWSDRSTENPRNITMTKNEALSAYFVKEYVVEPTFTIEKVWENTNVPAATADGYQAVGWDGQVYMQNKTAGQIQVFSNSTDAPTNYAVSNTNGQQIAIDEAGNMIVFNAYFATATPTAIQIYKKGSTTAKAVTFTLKDPARCDFFSASGDIYSAEGGYVYFYCAGKTVINRLKITNGAATAADVTTDVVGEAVYSSPQNTNYVMVDIFGNLVAHARSNAINAIDVYTNESKAFTLPSIKMGTLGGCSFELGGKELWAYHAGASNYSSEWNIYNMTDSKFLSDDDFYAVDKEATTNNACNWLNVQIVDENTAYIYQFCPKKAVAVWKVTMHEVVLRDTENNEDLLNDLNGSTTNVSVYRSLTGGMYNTLCLPFDVNELTGTPLENATVWQYNRVTVKGDGTNKEIFLEFDEVESITAGEPYLVEPAEDIAAPMEFKNVTISVTSGNDVAQDAVTMHGILHPTELEANDKSILFLVENNNLAWANVTANMNGMRAYFQVNEPSLQSARTRAYIRREPTVATDMENITTSETEIKKVIYNGTLYIIRGDEVYTIQGTKVK